MKVAGVAELKARLSLYLASVKEGEEVTVTDRGKPIARLVPLDAAARGHRRLQELARLGLVRLPRRGVTAEEILDRPRPDDPQGRSLRALLEEREMTPKQSSGGLRESNTRAPFTDCTVKASSMRERSR